MPQMTSRRPYLLRAMYEWIADNDMTPHLLVDAGRFGVQVPAFAIDDGKVVLNVAGRAVVGLEMGNEVITFSARFGGASHSVRVPVSAVLVIYARESGLGLALPDDVLPAGVDETALQSDFTSKAEDSNDDGDGGNDHSPPPRRSGHLRVVK